jgi:hypothetical protein
MSYKNKSYLYEQHWAEMNSLREIGRKNDVSHKTISYWFEKFDLPKRGVGGELPWVPFRTEESGSQSEGYEKWRHAVNYEDGRIDHRLSHHRLLAVAEFGFDAVCDMHVHHKNEIKWDNRPENLEIVEPSEHIEYHHKQGNYDDNEFWKESPNHK